MNHSTEHQSSYRLWTWLVAILLALILLWMLLTGRGPSSICCDTPIETATSAESAIAVETTPAEPVTANEAFSFTATSNGFVSKGDNTNVAWLSRADGLNAILSGEDLRLHGDNKNVLLSGIVDSEAIKQQKGVDAQAFFGPDIMVNNQLVIKASK